MMIQLCFWLACYGCGNAITPGDETKCGVCPTTEESALGTEPTARVDICPRCMKESRP
jgi:NMD protein affecting ribosome stability and mRNA decay